MLPFDGYVDKKATQKKVIQDVLKPGDSAFRTGDILTQDEEGYFYFRDRTGDTFRWKGENVSTNEVEGIISSFLQQQDVVSYGVQIPGTEGRAGMVCIVDVNNDLNLNELHKQMTSSLPAYARPLFIRVCREVSTTGTFKLVKGGLREQGFDPTLCGNDLLFYFSPAANQYVEMTREAYQAIENGQLRF